MLSSAKQNMRNILMEMEKKGKISNQNNYVNAVKIDEGSKIGLIFIYSKAKNIFHLL